MTIFADYYAQKLFLSSEPDVGAPSFRQMNKDKKLPVRISGFLMRYRRSIPVSQAWLSGRCRKASCNVQKTFAYRASSGPQKVTFLSRGRQFLQSIIYPSSRAQANAFESSSSQLATPPSPLIWSCVKTTSLNPKTKKRRRRMN